MTPLIKSLVSLTEEASDYVWFDIGILPSYSFKWSEIIKHKLPYERVSICGIDSKGDRFLVLADQCADDIMLFNAWALMNDRYTSTPTFGLIFDDTKDEWSLFLGGELEGITKEQAAPIVGIVAEFISRIDKIGYKPTIKNSHINRQRAKKGKAPLIYDWHTVKIEPSAQKLQGLGGTHASPRKHQRRGHWRNHPNGKRVWVRDCWVGDASKGMVFKDYEVPA